MLSRRLTSKFKYVSIYDPATFEIPDKIFSLYVQTRDFSILEEHIEKLEKKPSVFHVLPLRADKEYLADGIISNPSETYWSLFRHHVKGADNFQDEGKPLLWFDEETELVHKDCRDAINRDTVQEIASVILHKANESTKPFIMPDTWWRTRIQSRALHAKIAEIETASEPNTK